MSKLRLLIIATATIFVLTLAAFAFISQPPVAGEDVIVIKGGSLEIQCGKNHGNDCLGTNDNKGKYKHKKDKAHISNVTVRDVGNNNTVFFSQSFDKQKPPQIEITYLETATATAP